MKERKKGGKREGERGLIAGREDGIMRCRFRDDAEGKRRAGAGDRQDDLLSRETRTTMGNDVDGGKENRENRPRCGSFKEAIS